MENSTAFGNLSGETALKYCNDRIVSKGEFLYALNMTACISNSVFAVITTLVNLLILIAVWRTPSLRSASMFLLSGLALSNLGTGLVSQLLYLAIKVLEIRQDTTKCALLIPFEMSIYTFTVMSLCTLATISFDRVLAISLRLRYKRLVTVRRAMAVIFMEIIVSGSLIVIRIYNTKLLRLVIIILPSMLLISTCFSYFMVFYSIRRYQSQIQVNTDSSAGHDTVQQTNIDMGKYRKSVITAVSAAVLIVLCYLPNICVQINVFQSPKGYQQIHRILQTITVTICMANSAVNPLLYIFRMETLRKAVLKILKKF